MPSWEALDDYLDTHAFDGLGLLGAIALLGLAASFVRADERKQLRFPAALLVVFAALYALGEQVTDRDIDPFLHLVALAAILGSVARSSFVVLHALYERQRRAPLPRILQQIVQGSLYAAVGLVVLRAAGVEPGSLLTGSALVTAVIGLSLQETLGNLFAGLAIQAQQPFAVGDWVQFDADPANTAQVIEINWRATRLLTNDRVEITVPNGASTVGDVSPRITG